jgi:hypothetical protein
VSVARAHGARRGPSIVGGTQFVDAHTSDQCQCRRDFQTVFKRLRNPIELGGGWCGHQKSEIASRGIDQRHAGVGAGVRLLRKTEEVAACRNFCRKFVRHAENAGVPDKVGHVADKVLIMGHVEIKPINQIGATVEVKKLGIENVLCAL